MYICTAMNGIFNQIQQNDQNQQQVLIVSRLLIPA